MKCTEKDKECTEKKRGARRGSEARGGMECSEAQELFSPYLDGAVTGTQMLGVQHHIASCVSCAREYELLRATQQMLVSVGRPKAPADLGLKLRLAISHEAALARQPAFSGVKLRLQNMADAFMVPATAGFLSALVIFGIAMAYFVAPAPLQADNQDDVPLIMVNTAPEFEQSAFNMSMSTINSDSLVIEAAIGTDGRVEDYKILSAPKGSTELLPQVKQMLVFTTFRPALSMGQPAPGRAVLSFSRGNGQV